MNSRVVMMFMDQTVDSNASHLGSILTIDFKNINLQIKNIFYIYDSDWSLYDSLLVDFQLKFPQRCWNGFTLQMEESAAALYMSQIAFKTH